MTFPPGMEMARDNPGICLSRITSVTTASIRNSVTCGRSTACASNNIVMLIVKAMSSIIDPLKLLVMQETPLSSLSVHVSAILLLWDHP
jgi:hypothetical protein